MTHSTTSGQPVTKTPIRSDHLETGKSFGNNDFTFGNSDGGSTGNSGQEYTEVTRSDISPTDGEYTFDPQKGRNGGDVVDSSRRYRTPSGDKDIKSGERTFHEDVLDEKDIILVNNPIDVPYGRVRYLDSETDLKIRVLEGHRCHISVVNNEPITQRPGKLTPSNFSCQFTINEVQYTHLGGRYPSEDKVKLLLRYDTEQDTFIIPFTMNVIVSYNAQLEVVTKNMPLTVEKLLGTSEKIDRSNTFFAFDNRRHECKITLLHRHSDLPRYGVVISDYGTASSDYMVLCQDFLDSGIRYKHTVLTSTKLDYIPAVVELYDKRAMILLKQEYFQFLIRIQAGMENTIPSVTYDSLLLLDVNQFVMTALTPNIVTAVDRETPSNQLIYNVTKSLSYGEGILVSTDDQNIPLSSFYQQDISDLKIAYRPPAEDSDTKRTFDVELEVIDAEGFASSPFTVMIVVNPKMTKAPVTMKNIGLELFEGQSRHLSTARNLEIADEDNLEDVTVTVIGGLLHGRLLLMGTPTKQFSPADLDTGAVIYEHDGSETYNDNLLLRMSDGEHSVDFLFPITIFPEDDEPPLAHVNTGFEIREGKEFKITPFQLSATDIDSADADINYVMQKPFPNFGEMILRQSSFPNDPENWDVIHGTYERPADKWLQRDITDGILYYRHLGGHKTTLLLEKIYFTMSDNTNPPNESNLNEINIKILPVDGIPPVIHSECSLSLTTNEQTITPLTKENLQYTDQDSKDDDIIYHIEPLYNVDSGSSLSPGNIVLSDNPDIPIDSFSQAQVNHLKVSYNPPDQELGIVPRIIQFKFTVEDASGNLLSGQTFTIFLTPVNNQPPDVFNKGLQNVPEHSEVIINTNHLDVSDPDNERDDLVFTVIDLPKYGDLMYKTMSLAIGNEFTRRDIVQNHIKYINNGKSEVDKDYFMLQVSDGPHIIPVKFFIDIEPIDDEAPTLLELLPGTFGAMIDVLENQQATITSQVLKAIDPDSEASQLTYIIKEAPFYGRVLLNGIPTSSFTQMSIENNKVAYKHESGEIGKIQQKDQFSLILSDMSDEFVYGGNRFEQIKVNVTIKPVDDLPPNLYIISSVIVNESLRAPISLEHIQVSDSDTEDEKLTFTIIHQPIHGYIENTSPLPGHETSRKGIPISSFSLLDIIDGNINYVQSMHTKMEPRKDSLGFHCTDGINKSPDKTLQIYIEPFNDEMPDILHKDFIVKEGMELILQPPLLLAIDNDDPLDQLTFRVSKKPNHGKIVRYEPTGMRLIDEFSMEELSYDSKIVYIHDNSETTKDTFQLELDDGDPTHTVRKDIKIKILPDDDETPRLVLNTGVNVGINESITITDNELKAEDLDSPIENLIYIIRKIPRFGYLEIKEQPSYNLTTGMNFTQKNIEDGTIHYVHRGIPGVRDLFKFDLTDGINTNMDRVFYFTVKGEDNIFPSVVTKGVELPEGGRVALTTDILSTSDINSPDELLNFTITRSPSRGYLENSDNLGTPVTSFTQIQLAGNKIFYVHVGQDEMKMDSFEFVVTDGYNAVFRTFRISITDVDNKIPVLFLGTLKVQEGGSKLITPFELKLEDQDTSNDVLRFTITKLPLHGRCLYNKTKPTRHFTQSDLERNLISYQHDGSETMEDEFRFIPTDRTHAEFYVYPDLDKRTRKEQSLPIRIKPLDNKFPKMSTNRRATFLSPLNEKSELLGFTFTSRYLEVKDEDSPPEELTYKVERPPAHGYIISGRFQNSTVNTFTQDDPYQAQNHIHISKGSLIQIQSLLSSQSSPYPNMDHIPSNKMVPYPNLDHILSPKRVPYPNLDHIPSPKKVPYPNLDHLPSPKKVHYPNLDHIPSPKKVYYPNLDHIPSTKKVPYPIWIIFSQLKRKERHEEAGGLQAGLVLGQLGRDPLYRQRDQPGCPRQSSPKRSSGRDIISMDLLNGSATTSEDVYLTYARQVQFNPGQRKAQWRLRIVNDVSYEGKETLELQLRSPVMTALEHPLKAVISIQDEEDGSLHTNGLEVNENQQGPLHAARSEEFPRGSNFLTA
ncbi:extracellular matrix protein 3-like [Palaemon carinicauda]|uniref:extracellular matrix protein 3-like n=1 Tax=Palaemon carinicauda TaxID=392227 RepID=UPI0035B63402